MEYINLRIGYIIGKILTINHFRGGDEAREGGTVADQVKGWSTCPKRKILGLGLERKENPILQIPSPNLTSPHEKQSQELL